MATEKGWIVSICAGVWQLCGIKKAQELGYKVVAFDGDKTAIGLKEADIGVCGDIFDHDAIIEFLKEKMITPVGAIAICSEIGMIPAAKIRDHFNLSGCSVEMAKRLTNKKVQREICRKGGAEVPDWEYVKDYAEGRSAVDKFGLPVIVKPIDGAGSRGVTKVESIEELEKAIESAKEFSQCDGVICEKYLCGTEYTVETFSYNGVTKALLVTSKNKVEGTRGTVARELFTPKLSPEMIDRISGIAIQGITALEYPGGVGHTEVIVDSEGNGGIVEIAGRGGGFNLFEKFIRFCTGVDVVEWTIKHEVGEKINFEVMKKDCYGVLRFFPSRKGVVSGYTGIDRYSGSEDIIVESFVRKGTKVRDVNSDGDRLGCVIARAEELDVAVELADEVEENVEFFIENKG